MGFRGQYHPVHIVCDMDRVRSNIIFCEKKIFILKNSRRLDLDSNPGSPHCPSALTT